MQIYFCMQIKWLNQQQGEGNSGNYGNSGNWSNDRSPDDLLLTGGEVLL